MFKISGFSKLSKVPVKTLRYYDQIGLLKPIKTDQDTGYRYYAAEQLFEVNRIFLYKELGFTLKQIAHLLYEEVTLEQIHGMFKLKESEIEQLIEREQEKLLRIKDRMQLIRREGSVEREQEVIIKTVESRRLISFHSYGSEEEIPFLFRKLDILLEKNHEELITEPQIVLWSESDKKEGDFEFEVGYPVKGEVASLPKELYIRSLPEETTMATLLFRSNSTFAQSACIDLATWIEKNRYRVQEDQPSREIYFPLSGSNEERLIEIQIPIKL